MFLAVDELEFDAQMLFDWRGVHAGDVDQWYRGFANYHNAKFSVGQNSRGNSLDYFDQTFLKQNGLLVFHPS